jgi:hypothetical protein
MDASFNREAADIAAGDLKGDAAFLRGECDKNSRVNAKSQQKTQPADSCEPDVLLALFSRFSPRLGRHIRLAKTVPRGGDPTKIVPYEHAKHFSAFGADVSDFDKLRDVLGYLLGKSAVCVVQGGKLDSANPNYMQKLIYDTPDFDHPEIIYPATIFDKASSILPIDGDDLQPPPEARTLRDRALWMRSMLLPEFHNARCIGTVTASYGLNKGVRIRLWFRLDRALTCADKRRWLKPLQKIDFVDFVDLGLYSANQPVYTAAPVFEDPSDDPLFELPRLVVLDGEELVRTPHAERLKTPPRPPYQAPLRGTLQGDGGIMLSMACMTIRAMNAPPRDGDPPRPPRHEVIFEQCRLNVAPLVAAGCVDESYALLRITRAAADIGKTDENEIKRIFNDTLNYRREHMVSATSFL